MCFRYPNITWPAADLEPLWSRLVKNKRPAKLTPRTRDYTWINGWRILAYKVSECQRIYVIHSNIPTNPSIVNARLKIRKCLYVMNVCTSSVILHTKGHGRRTTGPAGDWLRELGFEGRVLYFSAGNAWSKLSLILINPEYRANKFQQMQEQRKQNDGI